jgi:hypothetical protein
MMTKSKRGTPRSTQTKVYKNVRDVLLSNANTNTVYNLVTNGSGQVSGSFALSPLGVFAPALVAGVYINPTVIDPPHLKWLSETCQNFGMYRITRATLCYVSALGTNTTGTLLVTGFRDVSDVQLPTQAAYQNGKHAYAFPIAEGSLKELRMPLPIDNTWHKTTYTTALPANTNLPWSGTNTQLAYISTVDDLCFTSFSYLVQNAPNVTNIGNFFVDYDVEFGDPESLSLNF